MALLKAEQLEKTYQKKVVLDNFNLELKAGSVLALLGENGAGKSTAIRLLIGKEKPDAGRVLFREKDIHSSLKDYQAHLGYVPQELALFFPMTVKENLKFWFRAFAKKGADEKKAIDQMVEALELGEHLNKKVARLSGGYQRRLNIACALFNEPEIVIMDEPTVGIDARLRRSIVDFVKSLAAEGRGIIYTSHYIDEIQELASEVLIMKEGRTLANLDQDALKTIDRLEEYYLNLE